ncbi:hypothetical protein Hanom_Chr09g00759611 [Helianthus anomalus]
MKTNRSSSFLLCVQTLIYFGIRLWQSESKQPLFHRYHWSQISVIYRKMWWVLFLST